MDSKSGEKSEKKDLKKLNFGKKRSTCKFGTKNGVEDVSIIKKIISTLHWNKKKDSLRASQKLARSIAGYMVQKCQSFI